MTAKQLALVIKVQANIRGFLTRKKIRTMQYNAGMGMGGYVYGEDGELMQDYDNAKVQVSFCLQFWLYYELKYRKYEKNWGSSLMIIRPTMGRRRLSIGRS